MASYPNSIYSATNPSATSPRNNPSLAGEISGLNGEVEAIETALGINLSNLTQSGDVTATPSAGSVQTTLQSTYNVTNVVRVAAYQDMVRRGGNIGVATSADVSSGYTYGQVEVVFGDSIAQGAGCSNFGKTDWPSVLATNENRTLGLSDPGLGFVPCGGGGTIYNLPQFAAFGASLTAVAGLGPTAVHSGNNVLATLTGAQLTGTVGSSTAANSLTDTRGFSRAIIFYKPQAGSDGIGVSISGQGGSVFHTIDGTVTSTPGNSTVSFYDTGALTSPSVSPTLSLTRQTAVTGGGGTAPIIYGVRYYAPGVAGTSGLVMDNIALSGTTTADWVLFRNWESYLGAISAQVRRVQIRLGGNDTILARTFTDATLTNTSASISSTSQAGFVQGDTGRPIVGPNIPANTTILSVQSSTQATMSAPASGAASGTYTLGQMSTATTLANLTTVIQRIRAQLPLAEIALFGEYQAYATTLSPAGMLTPTQYASTIVPMYEAAAFNNGCSYVDMFSRFGSMCHRNFNDAVLTNGVASVGSATVANFGALDVGSFISGVNIPANTTIVSVMSSTAASLSAAATGSASVSNYLINADIHGLTMDAGLHFGDYTNSANKVDGQHAHADEVIERLGYSKALTTPYPPVTTITATTNWLCPLTGTYLVTCVGGGGQGGGGGANSTGAAQQGGGGGGFGATIQQVLSLTGGSVYPVAIGAGGTGSGGGGAAGSHAGTVGTNGGSTTFGTGPLVLAPGGGGGGAGNASTNATTVNFAMPGSAGSQYTGGFTLTTTATPAAPGTGGGFVTSGLNLATSGIGLGGGGCGGSSNTTNGGGGGAAGSLTAIATFGGAGTSGTSSGSNGSNAASTSYGCGGGGGGGGTNNTGTGGTGGNGAPGVVYIQKIG